MWRTIFLKISSQFSIYFNIRAIKIFKIITFFISKLNFIFLRVVSVTIENKIKNHLIYTSL